jgi:ribosomal-protein-alanine N-acetyltransferase
MMWLYAAADRLVFVPGRRTAAEEEGRVRGARLSTLEVRRSNVAAIQLYRTMAYRQVGIRPNYYAEEHEDAIVMVKALG